MENEQHPPQSTAGFQAARLETGMDKTFWTRTTRSPNVSLNVDGHIDAWAEKITHVGAKNPPWQQQRLSDDEQTSKSQRCV